MQTLPKSLGTLFLTSLLLANSVGSFRKVYAQTPQPLLPSSNVEVFTRDELFFGRNKLGGEIVSDAEWQQFLDAEVTPRFPDGLTVVDAYGQYLNSARILTIEKTKILILIYKETPEKNQAIKAIIDSYKRKFNQESVLRVTSRVQIAF
jgi:Protein of unknown function (DUF3574).